MIIKCMYFGKKYNSKPDGKEVACTIQNSLKPVDMDIRDLAAGLAQGCTFRPAVLKAKTKDSFQYQELFAIDFDHDTTINETLKLCEDLKLIPAFAYTSFNHLQDGEHRFRLVFHSDRLITDYSERDKIQLALMRAFSKSDPQCKNADRLFFGGRQLICENYDSYFNSNDIINRFYEPKLSNKQHASNKPKTKRKISEFDNTHFEKIEAIKRLDVTAMKRLLSVTDTCNDEPKNNIKLLFVTTPTNIDVVKNIMVNVKERFGIGLNEILTLSQSSQLMDILDFIYDELNNQSTDIQLKISINDNQDNTLNSDLESNREKRRNNNIDLFISPPKTPYVNSKQNYLFKCRQDLFDFITSEIDLFEFLGVGRGYFPCFLPKHNDENPSAHVFLTDDGRQVYRCFGCDKSRSVIGVVEELSGCRRHQALEFVKNVYNLELKQSDWVIENQQILMDAINFLDSPEFRDSFPELNKRINRSKEHLKSIIMSFIPLINEDLQINGRPLFFASYSQLQNVTNIRSKDQIVRMITQFTALKLIEKLADDSIPENVLNKSKSIAKSHGFKKRCNFYSVEDYGITTLSQSEEMAKLLKNKNVRSKGISREMFLRTFGDNKEEIDKIYPQHKNENQMGTSEKSDKLTLEISLVMVEQIDKKGYVTECEIIKILKPFYKSETVDRQLKRSLQEILDTYGLSRVRANKTLKERYKIDSRGYPCLIIQTQDY